PWLAAPPGAHRPRSGCSCASPNRSAYSISTTVAFATSIPTSMTLVDARCDEDVRRVVTERPHRRVALLRLEPPVHQADLELRKHLGQTFRHHGRSLQVGPLRFVDHRIDHVCLPAGHALRPDEVVDLLARRLGAKRGLHDPA